MKKQVLILCLIAVLVSSVSAISVYVLHHPSEAEVPETYGLTEYLDDQLMSNGSKWSWGNVTPGVTYTKNLTVVNSGNSQVTVYLRVSGLPDGWSLTWTGNNTVLQPQKAAVGNLDLSVPGNATGQKYQWDSWVEGEE